eukprot:11215265-Lingulodinium_polyedra.AAC.1
MSWPGLLALFTSIDPTTQAQGLSLLRQHHAVYDTTKSLAASSPWLAKLARKSPFATTLMAELAAFVGPQPDPTEDPGK